MYYVRSRLEVKDERFPRAYSQRMQIDETYTEPILYCYRERCDDPIITLFQSEDGLKFPHDVVVLSMEDGNKRPSFCSKKCAALWLTSQVKK